MPQKRVPSRMPPEFFVISLDSGMPPGVYRGDRSWSSMFNRGAIPSLAIASHCASCEMAKIQLRTFRRNGKSEEGLSNVARVLRAAASQAWET